MKTTTKQPKRIQFEGRFTAYAHRIEFYYDIGKVKLSEGDEVRLTEEAEERARVCLADDCRSGELCCVIPNDAGNSEREFHGGWAIVGD